VINERGKLRFSNADTISAHPICHTSITDNRPTSKPHFAAVSIQPPAAKPAPAITQAISTSGTGTVAGRSRPSLVPVSRPRRMSAFGGGNAYQPFALPVGGSRRLQAITDEKDDDSDRSGSLGPGLTEKEIDERVAFFCFVPHQRFLQL